MDLSTRLESLLTLAEQIGIDVRAEPMGGTGGGLCRFRGKQILFVDTAADLEIRYEKTLVALAPLPELESRFVLPEIRRDIEIIRQQLGQADPD
jgi:hypothetical protein